jgi:hypothetical protein
VSEVKPSSVEKSEEFTLAVQIENCGDKTPQDISFEIIEISPNIIVKESLKRDIPKLAYANSERFVKYHLETTKDIKPGTHTIKMRLTYSYGDNIKLTKDYETTVDVIGKQAELTLDYVKTDPVYVYQSEVIELKLGIINYGKGVAKSINVIAEHPFTGIKSQSVGSLSGNQTASTVFKVKPDKAGDFDIPVQIMYSDDFGNHIQTTSIKLTVLNKKGSLNIASIKIDPVLPNMGDMVELTMRIENFGERTINSIRVYADHPFKGLKESFIGTLDKNEDGPAVMTFIADKSGEFDIPIRISYTDDFGEEQIQTKVNLIVLETNGGAGTVVLVLIILGVIGGLIYYNYKIKRSKDKIIKQLMKSNGNSTDKKR